MTSPEKTASLAQMLEAAIASSESDVRFAENEPEDEITRTTYRVPDTVLAEVSALARANRMSVSLLINLLLDSYLIGEGRPGYAELAPWYPHYVMRRKT